jgi:hypothetical protein
MNRGWLPSGLRSVMIWMAQYCFWIMILALLMAEHLTGIVDAQVFRYVGF